MFLLRRFCVANREPTPPCPACESTSRNTEDVKEVVTVTAMCQSCQNNSSNISVNPAPASCAICQLAHGPFPEASPWEGSSAPPTICIACVEQSLSAMNTSGQNSDNSSTIDSQAAARRQAFGYLLCLACHKPLPASFFPDGRIVESCQHEPEVCLDCIEKAIIESLDNDLPQCISCPQCGRTMSPIDIWRFSGNFTFKR